MQMINEKIFSANKIQDFLDCARRFELKYVLQQSWPAIASEPILEIEEHIKRGNQFHFLLRQFFTGVPKDILRASIQDDYLSIWFENALAFLGTLVLKRVFSEFHVDGQLGKFKIQGIFDVIYINEDDEIGIIDWKTSKFIPKKETLAVRIQTILYPLLIQESSTEFLGKIEKRPENIFMLYWFPARPDKEIIFPYSQLAHENNGLFIFETIQEITSRKIGDFELTDDEKKCLYCPYRSLCNRGTMAGKLRDAAEYEDENEIVLDFDQIPDIQIEF